VAVPLIGLAAGVWFGSDPDRPQRVLRQAQAGVRAVRLAVCFTQIVADYRWTRRQSAAASADDSAQASLAADRLRHKALQEAAWLAEEARSLTVDQGASASEREKAEAVAAATRDEAGALGEQIANRTLELDLRDAAGTAAMAEAHERCAARLLALCLANGGIYVKLGQHIGQLDYLVPEAYTRVLSPLFEHNSESSWDDVVPVVTAELGIHPDEAYDAFERLPIASASLAQVHRARHRQTGEPLAVKVQHARLREALFADVAAVGMAVSAAAFLFPQEFTLQWVYEEMAEFLPLELDFRQEAANANRCRAFFSLGGGGEALAGRVVVPAVDASCTTARVLTMRFEDGLRVTDAAGLRRAGLSPSRASALLSEAFLTMVFTGNFVHCDPHPGNILCRPAPAAAPGRFSWATEWLKRQAGVAPAPQLVILDHGLYRDFDRSFVLSYARLWRSIVTADADGIRAEADWLGVGRYYTLLAAMLTARPWSDILRAKDDPAQLRERGTAADKAQIRTYATQYAKAIAEVH
jgi:aarF domain-containing kinase